MLRTFQLPRLFTAVVVYGLVISAHAAEQIDQASPRDTDSPNSSSLRYEGRTEAEWQEWLKNIDLQSSAAASAARSLAAVAVDRTAPETLRKPIVHTLGRIDASADVAVEVFDELLNDPAAIAGEDSPRSWALKGIALLGRPAAELTPHVIEILEGDDTLPLDRLLALEALARIGAAHARTLSAIVSVLDGRSLADASGGEMMDDEDFRQRLRTGAAEVLVLFGPAGSPAIPSLLQAARSDHEPLRRAAVTTLGPIGNPLVTDALIDTLLLDESPAVRDAAAVSLAQLGAESTDVFVPMLGDPEAATRIRAADGLRRIGKPAAAAVAPLQQMLTDQDLKVRVAAAEALWTLTGALDPALDSALTMLAVPQRDVRIQAHRLILTIGRESRDPEVLKRLEQLVDSRDPRVRQAASIAYRELQKLIIE
ncbi:MAG: HEAT repeat domain-containing protein [Planctomycetaceae bacterium]|nr:HEAT repeat domain-containing protein [Planctomycetaceae bacterium]